MSFGVWEAASLVASTDESGFSTGISDTAVSIFSVDAGRNSPCGSFAARTWPVPASATTHEDASMSGRR
jgi:hypothetical protein